MSKSTTVLPEFDVQRLATVLRREEVRIEHSQYLLELVARMESCDQVDPQSVPSDLVTMNSRIGVKALPSGREFGCTLVFPHQADSSRRMISVLAPFGAALLGARVGITMEVTTPGGHCLYKIKRLLYQPESQGHFHL